MKKFMYFIAGIVFAISINAYANNVPFFKDISMSDWFGNAAVNLQEKGIITGYPDGTFQPTNNVNRAEMAVILDRYDNYASTNLIPAELHSIIQAMNSVNQGEIDEGLRDEVIMAEARLKESKEMPANLTEIADAQLPDGYTAYSGGDCTKNNPCVYLKYEGGRDINYEGPFWYGPYYSDPYAENNPGYSM